MHFSKLLQISVLCIIALMFVSCSEIKEITEFLLPENADNIYMNLKPDSEEEPDASMVGLLITGYHTDTINTEYNGPESDVIYGYVELEHLIGSDISVVTETLENLEIPYTISEELHPTQTGTVVSAQYAGHRRNYVSDDPEEVHESGSQYRWYVNPMYTINLTVSMAKPILPEGNESNTIYITFDDGPTESGTYRILDVLDTYGIKATFFCIGKQIEKYPESTKEIFRRGNIVACHSMSHDYDSLYRSVANFTSEIDTWVSLVKSLNIDLSVSGKIFRYPGGSTNSKFDSDMLNSMNGVLNRYGFKQYDWNIVVNDALLYLCPDGKSTYDYIKENFLETYEASKNKEGKKILLLHEAVEETIEMLPYMIEYMIEDGCTFGLLN